MQLFYGTYAFPVNATELMAEADFVWNSGGQPMALRKSLHVHGWLGTQNQLDAAIQESTLRTALATPFQDVNFMQDTDIQTPLSLLNAGSITGVRVTNLKFPTSQGPEYTQIRSFECTFEAEYPLPNSTPLLMSWTETLTFEGGLPIFRHRLAVEGPNQKQLVIPQDTYRATQTGQASGYRLFPSAPAPLWPYALKQAPRFTRATPERKGPTGYQGYGLTWQYEYEDIGPLIGLPNLWPIQEASRMATIVWISGAPAIAQVTTLTVGGTPQLAAPVQNAPTLAAGGALTVSTPYYWVITATNATGETVISNEESLTPTSGNQTGSLSWGAVTGAGGYRIYRSTTSGSYGASSLVTTISSGSTTTYSDTGGATTTGTPPASNTAAGMTYTVAMGINATKTVTYTSSAADTNATVAANLQAVLVASTYPEFQEETWANPAAGLVTASAYTAGIPFTLTASATGSATLNAATVAGSGPNDVSIASNWSTNALPVSGDDVYFTQTSQGALYNLSALSSVTLNSLTWDTTFTGQVGLPAQNSNGYAEYRPLNFQISATTETYLPGTGGGSQLIQRDNGSAAWNVNVNATGSPATQGRPALLLKGGNAANVLNLTRGTVGSAIDPGDTASWATINVGYQTSKLTDVNLTLGAGCTLGTITQDGGQVTARTAVTTWTQNAGTATYYGSGALTSLDAEGGSFSYQSSGTLGTLTVGPGGTIDFSTDPRARAITNATIYGTYIDPNKTVSWTNPVSFPLGIGGTNGATVNLGTEFHLQRS